MKFTLILVIFLVSFSVKGQYDIISLAQITQKYESIPLICGHRGGYYLNFPENSISIIKHISKNTNDNLIMFEIDIRADKNGELWIMHDENLERTTNGKGSISSKTTTELKKLRLKSQSGKMTTEPIPTFENFLSFVQDKNIYLMLDIKDDIYNAVFDGIKKFNLENRCVILTFSSEITQKVLKYKSEMMVSSLITSEKDYLQFKEQQEHHKRLAAYVTPTTQKNIISLLKKHGHIILGDPREVWNNVTSPMLTNTYKSLVDKLQLDILVTDFPIEVNAYFSEQKKIKNQILDVHNKKFNWFINRQTDSLTTLLDDDVFYIHSNGWKESKEEMLHNITSGKLIYNDIKIHESDARIIGETGVVTGKGTFSVTMDNKQLEINLYYTEVYSITDHGIKLFSRHACRYQ